MKKENGGITKPRGFFASGLHCGIKKSQKDLCLIYSQRPADAAAVFTSNKVKAAPLLLSEKNLRNNTAQAIIANSGNANCLTGKVGVSDAEKTIRKAAVALGIKASDVLVASTGIIGRRLPVEKIIKNIDKLVYSLGSDNSDSVSRALMTTDTVPKKVAVSFKMGSKKVYIGAAAKGAGMIHPNMATMLAFITSDACISATVLKRALRDSVDESFNSITVDGDTSTNDCVFALANGLAGNKRITQHGKDYDLFKKALSSVCIAMAEAIVRDAEGATKFIRICVEKARSETDARKAAYAVATSPLVKTAFYGKDPNWGRIAASAGRSGVDLDVNKLDIYLGGKKVLSKGEPTNFNKGALRKIFMKKEIDIMIALNNGKNGCVILTSDLSKKYIDINAHYTT